MKEGKLIFWILKVSFFLSRKTQATLLVGRIENIFQVFYHRISLINVLALICYGKVKQTKPTISILLI